MRENPKAPYDDLLYFEGSLTLDQVTALRTAWENAEFREQLFLGIETAPNRLHGAYVNDDGDAV